RRVLDLAFLDNFDVGAGTAEIRCILAGAAGDERRERTAVAAGRAVGKLRFAAARDQLLHLDQSRIEQLGGAPETLEQLGAILDAPSFGVREAIDFTF